MEATKSWPLSQTELKSVQPTGANKYSPHPRQRGGLWHLESGAARCAVSDVKIRGLFEEPTATVATTIVFTLSKHNAAHGTTNQYLVALTGNADIISNSFLVCHPGVTIFAYGSVGNIFLMHLEKQSTS